jgi:hypothetical protein
MKQGTRKLVVTLAALVVGAGLALAGRLTAEAVELIVWVSGTFVAGNALVHVAQAFKRGPAATPGGEP